MSATMREAQALDWLEDLREFGADVVSVACGEWRRTQTKRPTPADIRRLAIEERGNRRDAEPVYLPGPDRKLLAEHRERRHEEMIREGRDICNRWARDRGFADFSIAEQHGLKHSDVVRSIFEAAKQPEVKGFMSPGAALGVTAREFNPSPERLAADRRALGLEDDAPGEAQSEEPHP